MASPPKPALKPVSKWGSFLQQAVAGVESRLDNILAEGNEQSVKDEEPNSRPTMSSAPPNGVAGSNAKVPSRAPSNSTTTARLQERLANSARLGRSGSSAASSAKPSRTASPAAGLGASRTSLDVPIESKAKQDLEGNANFSEPLQHQVKEEDTSNDRGFQLSASDTVGKQRLVDSATEVEVLPRSSLDSHTSALSRPSADISQTALNRELSFDRSNGSPQIPRDTNEYEATISQLRSDNEAAELRRQEEVHTYLERIDALQAKLQYLVKEATETAKAMTSSVAPGSLEKKILDKDQQIALLMEEGQTLSKNEMRYLATIKKLRLKIGDHDKALAESKRARERADQNIADLTEKVKQAELAEKRGNERLKALSKIEKDVENLHKEKISDAQKVASLKAQIAQSESRALEAEKAAQTEALDSERKAVLDLKDDLSSLRVEKELSEERLRAEIQNLKRAAEREKERYMALETELRGEQSILESKMEVLRARAEEVSTGATGDAQAKLLRQIETLQSQYAIASENWQGIESSMQSRLTNIERERDEAVKKEGEIRRKAREVNIKSKKVEQELEASKDAMQILQEELQENKRQTLKLQQRADHCEKLLTDARASFEREHQLWETQFQRRLEEEKSKWREENLHVLPSSNSFHRVRTESPTASSRKHPTAEFLGPQQRRDSARNSFVEIPKAYQERPQSRRASVQPPQTPELGTPRRRDSQTSMTNLPMNGEASSVQNNDHDYFEGVTSPHSPHRTINDMMSVSTAAAGPSVQLVERMSAAVRRLESEKAAFREELARLSAQRDEAREEVVELMREVEEKRAGDIKVSKLETEIAQLNERYQTTLEMLGEKSEMVEELKADIIDLKQIYRDLLDKAHR